jgi:hypothetical protein
MKKVAFGVFCLLFAGAVYAQCTSTRVVTPEGKVILCQTCCYEGNCTTTCY